MSPLSLLCLTLWSAAPEAGAAPGKGAPRAAVARKGAEAAISAVLDDWHRAAAQADEARYFGHFAQEAVFLGTDGTERWTREEFRAWARPYFTQGKAWNFRPSARQVRVAEGGAVAWFDEALATDNMGPARGSGVLVKEAGAWRIAQYNLSVPIPNELLDEVKARIEAEAAKKK